MTTEEVARLVPDLAAQISENYPEVKGASSTVEEKQPEVPSEALRKLKLEVPSAPQKQFVVTFRRQVTVADGTTLLATVRATLDDHGRLLRVTGSKKPQNE